MFIIKYFSHMVHKQIIAAYCMFVNNDISMLYIGNNDKYWYVDKDGFITSDSDAPYPFYMELCGQSKCVLRAGNGCYLKGEQNGIITAKSVDRATATSWEY